MKKIIQFLFLVAASLNGYTQVLIEDKSGDQIASNYSMFGINAAYLALIKINTGDQSIGFNYYVSTVNHNPANYWIHEISLKAKPTEGYAAVFSNGQFSPGIKAGYSLVKVPLFRSENNYTDWLSINTGYEINKYLLYNKNLGFKDQLYNEVFKGCNFSFTYNALVRSKSIFCIKAGYARSNNYEDLSSLEVKDIISFTDAGSSILRQTTKTKTAKEGAFEKSDTYPLSLSYTRATQTDPAGSLDATKLRIGYTIYAKNIISNELPQTSFGIIGFLTKQNSSGVRTPVLGIILQAKDPFDVNDKNNGFLHRIEIGLTSVIGL